MSLLGLLVSGAAWLAAAVIVYSLCAYVALFYLPPAEELPNGTVADAVFVFTAPFVLAVTWLSAANNGRSALRR